jgi:CheY-like chemotaxis protein
MITVDSPTHEGAIALVVDDDDATRMLVGESLRQKGFSIRY